MAISTFRLNQLYENASSLEQCYDYRMYSSPKGAYARKTIGDALSELQSLSLPQSEKLLGGLRTAFAYIRSLLSARSQKFWLQLADEISDEIASLENVLGPGLLAKLQVIVDFLKNEAPAITDRHGAEVLLQIAKISEKTLLIPDTSALAHHYAEWASANGISKTVTTLMNRGSLGRLIYEDFACVIFPAAPSRFATLEKFDVYLKTLLFSGFAQKIVFISPNWAHSSRDFTFYESVFPGLPVTPKPHFVIDAEPSDDEYSETSGVEDFEIMTNRQEQEYEPLDSFGPEPCRLIRLNGNLAYPIEADAKRVSILEFSEKEGRWIVTPKNPFGEVNLGEILIACVSGSESEALRDKAALELGADYARFLDKQDKWKSKLSSRLTEMSQDGLVLDLISAGIETAPRVGYWLLPDSIQPGVPADFQKLLHVLGFEAEEVSEIRYLASKFDGALIKAGRSAGKSLIESLDDTDFAKLESGAALQITLENFGDATYLLAPIVNIDDDLTSCRTSQIRQLVHSELKDK